MRKKPSLNSILNSLIAALSVAAVFAVLNAIPETEQIETDTIQTTNTTLFVIEEDTHITTTPKLTSTTPLVSTTTTTTTTTSTTTTPAATTTAETTTKTFSVEDEPTTTTTTKSTTTTTKKVTATTTTLPLPIEEFEEEIDPDIFGESDITYPEDEELEPVEDTEPDLPVDDITLPGSINTDAFPMWTTTSTSAEKIPVVIPPATTLRINSGTVDAFSLICAVVEREMGESFSDEAIKAQAVAAYSYIKHAEIAGDYASVLTDYDYSKRIEELVASVWGQAVYYGGEIASTPYFASSAGSTASSVNVWGGALPYLTAVATPFDMASDPNYGIKKTVSESSMRQRLENNLGITLSGNPANWILVYSYHDGVYVDDVSIDGQRMISGRDFREDIMDFDIRSHAFTVTYNDGTFTITTYGYGHGVGMPQNGANILAKQGLSYKQILEYFYSGVTVQ
ncbi:MAG: SpoIID/LytB domain-containing protein [Ruminococcus sp.]|jgi:stage II sporulation protein D|nr:SpoIID/LytB domain-containing protein [Ruminococcus sp.]